MLHVLVAAQRVAYAELERVTALWNAANLDGAKLRMLAPQMKAAHDRFVEASKPLSGPWWAMSFTFDAIKKAIDAA